VNQTLLAVPVPEAEHLVRAVVDRYETEFAGARAEDCLAHITVLTPFLPLDGCTEPVRAKLGALFAERRAFRFRLGEVEVFPGEVVYLAPEPAHVFVDLTRAAVEAFPGFLPYGGRFRDVIPHLTVGPIRSAEMERELVELAGNAVPIDTVARAVALIEYRPDAFETVATFPFGEE
jgi:2'-5' RNA ligase